ncbi:MAG: uroporphyrinogen decarboxylase family protein [Candidatus Sedimenticola sp. (ex Thyasira tokunagai)]
MSVNEMTSMERVLNTLQQKEADRVPFFLLLSLHGAKEMGLGIEAYFSDPEAVAEGQLRLRKRYGHDCYYTFYHASIEVEAWGGSSIFYADGPPNAGMPPITTPQCIDKLAAPDIDDAEGLQRVLKTQQLLKAEAGDEALIIGVVMSPFSLPVMQMGFEAYLMLMQQEPDRFQRLMDLNERFTVAWANAQLAAGAHAICYFDPVASTTIIPRELYLETGFKVAKRTLPQINGPIATHMASGRCKGILQDLIETGTGVVGVSTDEDLAELKQIAAGKLTLLGNLNGITMRRWSPQEAEDEVRRAIAKAGRGGGFILSDNHGEIPWQVSDEVLQSISDAVHQWGRYPLDWVDGYVG